LLIFDFIDEAWVPVKTRLFDTVELTQSKYYCSFCFANGVETSEEPDSNRNNGNDTKANCTATTNRWSVTATTLFTKLAT